jgi:DNA-binding LytR/AlgR family response regulator
VLSALQKYDVLENPEVGETLSSEAESIFIKVDTNLVRLKFDDILWMEALGDYVGFHTSEKRYVVKVTLAYIEKRIAKKNFTRVHRSFMVNTDKIKMIDDSSLVINNKLIPISRGSRAGLMESINLLK